MSIALADCWAHLRRGFEKALPQALREAGLVLHLLESLYRTESRLRQTRAGSTLRALARDEESRLIIQHLHAILLHWQRRRLFLPKSRSGRAIAYALSQWASLQLYLENGAIEIDTNLVENAIRPTAVGKKTWLFIGKAAAGQRSSAAP